MTNPDHDFKLLLRSYIELDSRLGVARQRMSEACDLIAAEFGKHGIEEFNVDGRTVAITEVPMIQVGQPQRRRGRSPSSLRRSVASSR